MHVRVIGDHVRVQPAQLRRAGRHRIHTGGRHAQAGCPRHRRPLGQPQVAAWPAVPRLVADPARFVVRVDQRPLQAAPGAEIPGQGAEVRLRLLDKVRVIKAGFLIGDSPLVPQKVLASRIIVRQRCIEVSPCR